MNKSEQIKYLLRTMGEVNSNVKEFSVECMIEGGGYTFNNMVAPNISEVINTSCDNNKYVYPIARLFIDPVERGVIKKLQLYNHARIK